jgi:DNA-directed RNA polymerase subunit H (RpoH/RPB5)
LNGDFAAFKNNLKSHSDGIFIFQIDADETPHEFLVENIHELISANLDVDLFLIPRINTVDGITKHHVDKWGWKISKIDTLVNEKSIDTESEEYKLLKHYNLIIEETDL